MDSIDKIRKSKFLLQYKNILYLYENKKLTINGYYLTKENFAKLKILIAKVDEIFEEAWDFDFNYSCVNYGMKFTEEEDCSRLAENISSINLQTIYVHFPRVEISNENEAYHVLTDLFLSFDIYKDSSDGIIKIGGIGGIGGFRASASCDEIVSQYAHSHLNVVNYENFPACRDFCLGHGEINMILSELNSTSDEKTYEDNSTAFLLQLFTMASHESLDGGPYINLEDMISYVPKGSRFQQAPPVTFSEVEEHLNNNYSSFVENTIDEFYGYLSREPKPNLVYNNITNRFEVEATREFLASFERVFNEYCRYDEDRSRLLLYQRTGRNYYLYADYLKEEVEDYDDEESRDFDMSVVDTNSIFHFRDKEITFEITDLESYAQGDNEFDMSQEILDKFIINPVFKQRVIKHIEDEFNNKIFRNLALQRGQN